MVKKIKIMPEYGCSPLWWVEPERIGNIDPATLPLSQETLRRLSRMEADCNASLNWDDPASTPVATEEEIEAYKKEGISLWMQLRKELAPDYEVTYFSDRLGKVVTEQARADGCRLNEAI